ncbi:MAG: long-chain-fatty-acid--CoA ligase [Rhodospirillales bacterium]|nr:long-chain-fatty-acid--CoA ligase [Rhodospirillales bacterium]
MAKRPKTKPKSKKATARKAAAKFSYDPGPANFIPLSPVTFLAGAAETFPTKPAIIHGDRVTTYKEFFTRARRLASALKKRGVRQGDTVAIMAPNMPAMLEAHFAVPAAGAILNPLNYRLDAATIAFCLEHGEAKVLLTDGEFAEAVADALRRVKRKILVVDLDDPLFPQGKRIGSMTYEQLLAEGDPDFAWGPPKDEWQSICLLYTSGTTGNPKGVLYHHRGAYLASMGSTLNFGMRPQSVYLWTLPMFHCNGWTFTWAATAAGATHVCLRRMEPKLVFDAIERHRVTHLCGAPIVLNLLVHAPAEVQRKFGWTIEVATGGAAPPSPIIASMEAMGFRVTHMYGTTECYGPATISAWQLDWPGLPVEERARKMARQGVACPAVEKVIVADPRTRKPVPRDGETMGEIMLRANSVMKGYLKNPDATAAALKGGWYHTGDLAVWHEDNYIEVRDRAKDIIISGGENISSLEVEEALYRHPQVMEAAVVAKPDEKWGETPCAFVTLKNGASASAEDIIAHCKRSMAHFKAPRTIVFGPLPKTSTGKIQKFVLRNRAKSL